MQSIAILVAPGGALRLSEPHLAAARQALAAAGGVPASETRVLSAGRAAEFGVVGPDREALRSALDACPALDGLDWAVTPADGRRKAVLVADMDSTMIQIETLDTLAAELGFGEEVAEITARSMAGELDFLESLRARVALLKGHAADTALAAVMAKVVPTEGAERAVRTMAARGCLCALVSGGFTFTTEVVHAQLGFQEHLANTLEIGPDGRFTGAVTGRTVGRATKREVLEELCARQGVGPEMAAAIGDGANDLDMLAAAGLGIGFRPKPIVARSVAQSIRHTDMTTLLYFQGYEDAEFAV
jgi:phosphoserine phosphatase